MPTYTTNDIITNRIDKKINYGKARTDFDHILGPNNESIVSPLPSPSHNLWIDSHNIPTSAPTSNTSILHVYKYNGAATAGTNTGQVVGVMELTRDPNVASQRSHLACSTVGTASTRLDKWVRPTYGATYMAKFAIALAGGGNGNYDITSRTNYTEIYPNTTDEEFYFDYEAGVFVMYGNPNGSVSSAITAGGTGNYTNSIYLIQGYRYWDTSKVGLQNFSGGSGGGSSTLGGLTDVTITNPADNHIIKYDSSAGEWVNALNTGGGSGGISLTDLSVTAEGSATDDGSLSYNNNTGQFTYSPPSAFTGATNQAAGQVGFVPAPGSNVTDKYLKSDGTFSSVHLSDATNSVDGGNF